MSAKKGWGGWEGGKPREGSQNGLKFFKFICLVLVEAHKGLPSLALVVKNPPANAENVREAGLVPGSGRSSGGGHGNSPCPENPTDRGS